MYKPLTPALRDDINRSIDSRLNEFASCERNALVSMQITSYEALRQLINALPDGYPIPVEKG